MAKIVVGDPADVGFPFFLHCFMNPPPLPGCGVAHFLCGILPPSSAVPPGGSPPSDAGFCYSACGTDFAERVKSQYLLKYDLTPLKDFFNAESVYMLLRTSLSSLCVRFLGVGRCFGDRDPDSKWESYFWVDVGDTGSSSTPDFSLDFAGLVPALSSLGVPVVDPSDVIPVVTRGGYPLGLRFLKDVFSVYYLEVVARVCFRSGRYDLRLFSGGLGADGDGDIVSLPPPPPVGGSGSFGPSFLYGVELFVVLSRYMDRLSW